VTLSCAQPHHNMHDVVLTLRCEGEPALREHLQHHVVLWQDVGDQLPEPSVAGNPGKMAHQGRTDPLSLILIDDILAYPLTMPPGRSSSCRYKRMPSRSWHRWSTLGKITHSTKSLVPESSSLRLNRGC
jgi:hypothetical protein